MMSIDDTPIPHFADMLRMDGRVFVVIGAGQGIGRLVAHGLSQNGATVVCVGRSKVPTERIAEEVGGVAIVADAQERPDMERLFAEVRERFGRLDGILDTVAVGIAGTVMDVTDENFLWQQENVLKHAYLALQLGAPLMRDSGGGSVVFVGSAAGQRAFEGTAMAYSIFKAALDHLGRIGAVDLGPWNIRVNTASLGLTKTPRWKDISAERLATITPKYPLRRIGESSEAASAILFLLSDMASNVNGVTLVVDGGYSVRSPNPMGSDSEEIKTGWGKEIYEKAD